MPRLHTRPVGCLLHPRHRCDLETIALLTTPIVSIYLGLGKAEAATHKMGVHVNEGVSEIQNRRVRTRRALLIHYLFQCKQSYFRMVQCEPSCQQDLVLLLGSMNFNCKGGSRLGLSATWGDSSSYKSARVIQETACAFVVFDLSTGTVLRPSTLDHTLLDHTIALLLQLSTPTVPVAS